MDVPCKTKYIPGDKIRKEIPDKTIAYLKLNRSEVKKLTSIKWLHKKLDFYVDKQDQLQVKYVLEHMLSNKAQTILKQEKGWMEINEIMKSVALYINNVLNAVDDQANNNNKLLLINHERNQDIEEVADYIDTLEEQISTLTAEKDKWKNMYLSKGR